PPYSLYRQVGWGHAPPNRAGNSQTTWNLLQILNYHHSQVAWMEHSGIRDGWCAVPPDSVTLHPGYGLFNKTLMSSF
ncbi:MAG: hypothetical protein ABW105_06715, partial [Candidatus Thiodiazotropha sp. 6PLUC1]